MILWYYAVAYLRHMIKLSDRIINMDQNNNLGMLALKQAIKEELKQRLAEKVIKCIDNNDRLNILLAILKKP